MKKLCKQAISALLALLMLVSTLPIEVLALEPEASTEHIHDDSCVHDETDAAHDAAETDALLREMADILALFGVSDGADDEALLAAVAAADDETFTLAAERMQALAARLAALSEDEADALSASGSTAETYARLYGLLTEMYGVEEAARSSADYQLSDNNIVVTVSKDCDTSSQEGNTITVSAKGRNGVWGIGASSTTVTISIKNNGSSAKKHFLFHSLFRLL